MRCLVVYESMFGNTAAVAGAVADGLRAATGIEAERYEVDQAPGSLDGFELVVVGAPTHALSLPRPATRVDAAKRRPEPLVSNGAGIREWLQLVEGGPTPLRVAAFDTRIKKPLLFGSAARAAARQLRRRHFPVVGTRSFWVHGLLGPLVDGELDRARRWGGELPGMTRLVQRT